MDQPPLDHHYIVQHLGGAKSVERRRDGAPVSRTVPMGALTFVPAGTEFIWRTRGPIEFAHLYISPRHLEGVADRYDGMRQWTLIDRVGARDPLLEALYGAMLKEIKTPGESHALFLDCLLDAFIMQLLRGHTTGRMRSNRPGEKLPAFRVERVVEFVDAHIARDIRLGELAGVAGGSVYHFCRAFKNTVGETPYQFVLRRRVARAHSLLAGTALSLEEVARASGFRSKQQLSRAFRRIMGIAPTRLRGDA
jgi:AraC family transcriptional regulator